MKFVLLADVTNSIFTKSQILVTRDAMKTPEYITVSFVLLDYCSYNSSVSIKMSWPMTFKVKGQNWKAFIWNLAHWKDKSCLPLESILGTFPSKFLPSILCGKEFGEAGEREAAKKHFKEHTSVTTFWIEKGLIVYHRTNPNIRAMFLFETGDRSITYTNIL